MCVYIYVCVCVCVCITMEYYLDIKKNEIISIGNKFPHCKQIYGCRRGRGEERINEEFGINIYILLY